MVEIIVAGKDPGEPKYTVTCNKCQTMFRFKASETARTINQKQDGPFYAPKSLLAIKCPICSKEVYVDASKPDPTKPYGAA